MEKLRRLYNITFNTKDYKIYENIILDIFENNNLNHGLNKSNILNIMALYYECKIKNYNEMKKYYLMAIKLNNCEAMYNLGNYYLDVEKNYDKMNKYYLMAIILNDEKVLHDICNFNKNIETQHYLLRQINSKIAIKKVRELEKNNFLGVKIFKELTEYCFNPQRLLKLCNIYNVELNDYMDII